MSEGIGMLEGGVDGLQLPSRPFFCDEGHVHTEDTYHLSSELTEISEDMSENIDVWRNARDDALSWKNEVMVV